MECPIILPAKKVDNKEIIKLTIKIRKKTDIVLNIFLLKRSFKDIKNAMNGFLFLRNNAGKYNKNIK